MFTVVNKQIIGDDVKRLDISAETIARRVQPGQFVMVIPRENGEWIPLPVVESDSRKGTITVLFQEQSAATQQLAALPIKETIYAIMGPLGQPTACTKKVGLVVCVGTGLGVAQLLPMARHLAKLGNKVVGVIGAKTQRELLLESQMRLACYKIYTATNETSIERKHAEIGIVKQLLDQQPINLVYAAGRVEMMQAVAEMTKSKKIPLFVQIYPTMCCGAGFCGSCRLRVNHKTVLACEDGPEFDGHKIDFTDLHIRLKAYQKDGRSSQPAKAEPQFVPDRNKFSKFFIDLIK